MLSACVDWALRGDTGALVLLIAAWLWRDNGPADRRAAGCGIRYRHRRPRATAWTPWRAWWRTMPPS